MKIGVFSTFMSPNATPQMIRDFGRRAEGMGLDSIWMGEHVVLFDKQTSARTVARQERWLNVSISLSVAPHDVMLEAAADAARLA